LFLDGLLLGLLFGPEDEANVFFQNVSWLLFDYTALWTRREKSLEKYKSAFLLWL
jgi:hypothetical protein